MFCCGTYYISTHLYYMGFQTPARIVQEMPAYHPLDSVIVHISHVCYLVSVLELGFLCVALDVLVLTL